MPSFLHHVLLAVPLFMLALLGYGLARLGNWPQSASAGLARFVFSVEWSRYGSPSLGGLWQTARRVLANPIVAAIVAGVLFGLTGIPLPAVIDAPLAMLGQAAALVALGMSLAGYSVRAGLEQTAAICALKLGVQPLVIWLLARALSLPPMETQVVVLLGSLAMGANVYLMARQFQTLEGPIAASLVLSTALSVLTTPLALALAAAGI